MRIPGERRTASCSARTSSAPVASRAWTMRWRRWAASRPRASEPSAPRSKRAPRPCQPGDHVGRGRRPPARATASSTRPAPAATVSAAWSAVRSSAADGGGHAALRPGAGATLARQLGRPGPRPSGRGRRATGAVGQRRGPRTARPRRRRPRGRVPCGPRRRPCDAGPPGRSAGRVAAGRLTESHPPTWRHRRDGQHPVDAAAGPLGDVGVDDDLGGHRLAASGGSWPA